MWSPWIIDSLIGMSERLRIDHRAAMSLEMRGSARG
jgi:hypothetical protein